MPETTDIAEIKLDDTASEMPATSKKFNLPKVPKKVFAVVVVLLVLVLVSVFGVVLPLRSTLASAQKTYTQSREVYDSLKSQDIASAEDKLQITKKNLAETKASFGGLLWTKYIPFVGAYTSDGEHLLNAGQQSLDAADILLKAVVPYADILGLKGKSTFSGGTSEDRIVKAVSTLDKVVPEVDKVADKLTLIKKEVDQVDPNRYPETFQGKPVRSTILELKNLIDTSQLFLSEARPMVKKLPDLLGAKGDKRYMVLFQNDGELRPTGGFITAYAIFTVSQGKIHLETSDDIYKLDDTITKKVAPPEPISKYLNVFGWRLRDSNFSPDYLSSMKVFEDLYSSSKDKKQIDGIIAVDTHVLLSMMDVIGPVNIYGTNFTTAKVASCDCPMVIYELEKYADEPKSYERGSRKDIIGVLLAEILHRTMASPKYLLSTLVPTVFEETATKHILVYLHDADSQAGMEALGWAGRIKPTPPNSDYLHINDANLGGAKSNLYIKQKVTLNVDLSSGKNTNTLVVEYQHPRRPDNCSLERKEGLCLSGIYRDYVRIYLPKGATLLESRGFENKSTTFDDLDHTVVDGFFTVVPLGLAKIQLKYTTPTTFSAPYKIFLQKQAGTGTLHYKITASGVTKELDLTEDTEVDFK